MGQTFGQNFQDVQDSALPQLGYPARTPDSTIIAGISTEFESPLRMAATFPVADAKLNIVASSLTKANGSVKAAPNFQGLIPQGFVATTINFQTQAITGGTVAITFPTGATVGYYYRCALSLLPAGTLQAKFSAGFVTQGALPNPGTLAVGWAGFLGWIDLQATAASAFKTAGSATSIIENAQIYLAPLSIDTEIEKYQGQLRLSASAGSVSRAIMTGVDFALLNGTIFSQAINSNLADFGGAQIDFSTGTVYQADGVSALGNNFTPFAVPTSQYFWYAVSMTAGAIGADNRNLSVLNIQGASAANAVQGSAPYPIFSAGNKVGMVQVQNIGGTITVVQVRQLGAGSGGGAGGGGSSLRWVEDTATADYVTEYNEAVYKYDAGLSQFLYASVKIPSSYAAGSPIKLRLPWYSPDNSGNVLMQSISTLIRTGVDAINDSTNQHTSSNAAVTLSVGTVLIPQMVIYDLTDSSGKINGVSVNPDDTIKVALTRGSDSATSPVANLVYSSEATFQ